MRREEKYGPGGFDPGHPSRNVLEEVEWSDDDLTVTFRRYDRAGALLEERPATDADIDRLSPPPLRDES